MLLTRAQTFAEGAIPLAQSIEAFLLLQNVRWSEVSSDPEKVYDGGIGVAGGSNGPLLTVTCDEEGFVAHNEQAMAFLFEKSPVAWPIAWFARSALAQVLGLASLSW